MKLLKYIGYLFLLIGIAGFVVVFFVIKIPQEKNAVYFLGHWWDLKWEIKIPLLVITILGIILSTIKIKK